MAHGIAQGGLGELSGGDFMQSFITGTVASLGGSAFQGLGGKFAKSMAGGVSFSALSGGVASELSGGNFWKGAGVGATIGLLNHYGDEFQEKINKSIYEKKLSKILSDKIKTATLRERIKLKHEGEYWEVDFNIEGAEYKKGELQQNVQELDVKVYVGKDKYVDAKCYYAPAGNKSRNIVSKLLIPGNNTIRFAHSGYYPSVTITLSPENYETYRTFLYGLLK